MIGPAARGLLLAGALLASRARADAGGARTLTRVEVTGNTRTATRVIERALRLAPGDALEPGPAPELAQRIMNLRLFQQVDAWVEEDGDAGAVVHVTVGERWTLLPLPMVSGSGDRMQAGLLVMDSNFLGQGVALGVGGMIGSGGSGGMFMLEHPRVLGSDVWLRLNAGRLQERLERAPDGEVLEEFDRTQNAGGFSVGWNPRDAFRVGGGWWVQDDRVTAVDGQPEPGPDGLVQGPMLEVQLGSSDFHLDHESGGSMRLSLDSTVDALSARSRRSGRFQAFGATQLGGGTVSATLALQAVDGDRALDAIRLGGQPGSRGFQRLGLWAERAATVALEYQVTAHRAAWGSLAAVAFTDAGAVHYAGDLASYVTPGVGGRCYFRGIALPALGVDVGWRVGEPSPVVSFFLGFGSPR